MASAGEDKKISLWRKNGQSMGTIPVAGTDSGDNIEVILFEGCCFFNFINILGSGVLIFSKVEHQVI